MGAIWSWLNDFWNQEMEISILGLQNAGKTSFVHVLQHGEFQDNMIPTIGFNMRKVSKKGVTIKVWDMGGQKQFRGMWDRYSRDVDVIVFMVDINDYGTLEMANEELHQVLSHKGLAETPLLLLLNKIDIINTNDNISYDNDENTFNNQLDDNNNTQNKNGSIENSNNNKDNDDNNNKINKTPVDHAMDDVLNILQWDEVVDRPKMALALSCKTMVGVDKAVEWLTKRGKMNK